MRLRWLVGIVAVALLGAGGQWSYEAIANPAPAELTCADLAKARPEAGWLRLKGCVADVIDAAAMGSEAEIVELYVPLRPADGPPQTAQALLATRNPGLLALAKEAAGIPKGGQQAFLFVFQNRWQLKLRRDFEGMLRIGFGREDESRRVLDRLRGKDVAPGVIVIDEGRRPRPVAGAAMLLLALATLGTLALRARRGHDELQPPG